MTTTACIVCGERELRCVLDVPGVPVFNNVLFRDEGSARRAPTGEIALHICARCGHLQNTAFDPGAVEYASGYENPLHHSSVFSQFARQLATRLAADYLTPSSLAVEVGCGDGHFLSLLCQAAGCRGQGYDPSHDRTCVPPGVAISRDTFPAVLPEGAGLVVCRHVLEHVAAPVAFLAALRHAMPPDGLPIYVEVPDGDYMVAHGALWDLIYEHPSYFTRSSLTEALRIAGYEVLHAGSTFGGQFLWAEAVGTGHIQASPPRPSTTVRAALAFGAAYARTIERWRRVVAQLATGRSVVVWGAGSKGVSFVNALDGVAPIDFLVDVNVGKARRYVPCSAHRVAAPTELVGHGDVHVLLMNPQYREEVRQQLLELGIRGDIDVVSD